MVKLMSISKILLANGTLLDEGHVFDASAKEARTFDALGSARPATATEIAAHDEELAKTNGTSPEDKADTPEKAK